MSLVPLHAKHASAVCAGADCIAAALLPRRQPSNGKAEGSSAPVEDLFIIHGDGRLLRHRLHAVPASTEAGADDASVNGSSFGSTPDTVLRFRTASLRRNYNTLKLCSAPSTSASGTLPEGYMLVLMRQQDLDMLAVPFKCRCCAVLTRRYRERSPWRLRSSGICAGALLGQKGMSIPPRDIATFTTHF